MIILGTNSIKAAGGYDVANSCRFNSGSSDSLTRTFSTPTSAKKFTISQWVKRSKTGESQILLNQSADYYYITSADVIDFETTTGRLKTNRLFRDLSAWYHIVIVVDTTLGTADDRIKMFINGVQETSFASRTNPSQDANFANFNSATQHSIAKRQSASDMFLNGYLAEQVFLDGTAAAITDLGEFDSDSPTIWKPIDVSGLTFGNNGFHLDFEDSSALGNDVSGNNNDFTANNLTAVDQSTDTCTNNFATMNPLDTHSSATLSEGNLKIATTASGWFGGSGTIGITLGQPAYFEAKAISSARLYFGLSRIGQGVRGTTLNNGAEGDSNFDYMWRTTTANTVYYGGSNQSITIGAISANDICACSVASDGEVKFYLNDATVVTFSTKLIANYFYFPILSANAFGGGTETWIANFGSPAYAISSSNTDPDGHGNFEFATKGGYALNTKNLAEHG